MDDEDRRRNLQRETSGLNCWEWKLGGLGVTPGALSFEKAPTADGSC